VATVCPPIARAQWRFKTALLDTSELAREPCGDLPPVSASD